MPQRKPSDYRELREYISEHETTSDVELRRRTAGLPDSAFREETGDDLYLRFTSGAAGINMWDLHEEFDVDVVFAWHMPTKDRLSMGLRLRLDG